MAYGFALVTERRLEGVHAEIGNLGGHSGTDRHDPAATCSQLREQIFESCVDQDDFVTFLDGHWYAKWGPNSLAALLLHCTSEAELKRMNASERRRRLYMYDANTAFARNKSMREASSS